MQANTTTAQKILDGDLSDFSNQPEIIMDLLHSLQHLPSVFDSEYKITDEEFITGMRGIAEGKYSSQSSCHYSMYRAVLSFPLPPNQWLNSLIHVFTII